MKIVKPTTTQVPARQSNPWLQMAVIPQGAEHRAQIICIFHPIPVTLFVLSPFKDSVFTKHSL